MSIFPAHILLATDGSPHADLAAGVAVDLAQSTDSRLHVVAVGRTFPAAVYDEYAETRREDLRREAQEILDEQVRKIEESGGTVAVAHLKLDEQRDEAIVHLAEDIDAGMIVIGSRGFGGMRRALMGNVADSVVRHAHCPVLVVRPQAAPAGRFSALRPSASACQHGASRLVSAFRPSAFACQQRFALRAHFQLSFRPRAASCNGPLPLAVGL